MAKSNDYLISFHRAERSDRGYYTISFDMAHAPARHAYAASSFAALEIEVKRLAAEYGLPCSASVNLADRRARKPAGFDAWRKTVNIIEASKETVA